MKVPPRIGQRMELLEFYGASYGKHVELLEVYGTTFGNHMETCEKLGEIFLEFYAVILEVQSWRFLAPRIVELLLRYMDYHL